MPPLRSLVATLAAACTLAACGSKPTLDPRTWFSRGEATPPAASRENPGFDARLVSKNSTVTGIVRARESGDLLLVRVELVNAKGGTVYRAVFHDNGNCSSPNGFSAGAPWSPPGAKEPPARLIPDIYPNSSGNAILTARLRGVRLGGADGLGKRSVLVYEGPDTAPPKPDVPNNVVACGVFVPATILFP
jgi:Cu/Zn superoxide dismutase